MKTVDARGFSCPEPVIMTKNACDAGEKEMEVLVDTNVSKENVERYLTCAGYSVTISEDGDGFKLVAKKNA